MNQRTVRGQLAVDDMKARIEAGWSVSQLWDRFVEATTGDGFTYDYAEFELELEKIA